MRLYAVYMGYGLYVVRAEDQDDARQVAWDGPTIGDADPAERYGTGFDSEAQVLLLEQDGPRGLLEFHYG